MSEIRKGDLVMVVRPTLCCGNTSKLGKPFTVVGVVVPASGHCPHCGDRRRCAVVLSGPRGGFEPGRLLKIDPPAITQDTHEEATA